MKTLTVESTKQEEIETLDAMVKIAGSNSYLSAVFSPQLVSWIKQHISNDTWPSIWDVYQETIKESNDHHDAKIQADTHIAVLESKLADKDRLIDSAVARVSELNNRVHEAENRAIAHYDRICTLEDNIKALEYQNMKLKAQLFDISSK